MSGFPLSDHRFILDGEESLGASYDDEADVLYLWRGAGPVEAVSLTTDDGHVVRIDPETGDVVGFTIIDYAARWQQVEVIDIHLPALAEHERDEEEDGTTHHLLAMAI